MRIETALEKFLVQMEADGRSPHTIGQYRRHVRLLARWLAEEGRPRHVERIDHEDLALFLTSTRARMRPDGRGKKATSTNALRTSLRCFFAYLHAAGVIRENPARLVRRARCGAPSPRPLPHRALQKLLGMTGKEKNPEAERDHALFHLMAATGIRLGSALELDRTDIDLAGRTVRLRRVKGGRVEEIPLGKTIAGHLRQYVARRGGGPLFTDRRGQRISSRHAQRRFRMWAERAGICGWATTHSLRHGFAMRLYRETSDIALVQRALRHRSITSTLVYARADEERLRKALD